MSTATDALEAEYQTLIDALTDTMAKAKAAVALETWKGCLEASQTVSGRATQSYTIAGRTFTFRSPSEAVERAAMALAELESLLGTGGGVSYMDLSGGRYGGGV